MKTFTVRRRVSVNLNDTQTHALLRFINEAVTGSAEVNEMRDGRLTGKFPEKEGQLVVAHRQAWAGKSLELDLEFDGTGQVVNVTWVKPAGPKTLMQVFSERR